ncbi:MAG TPA: hypothetical protein DCS30_18085 [Rhizobiales bacterium]|nr:hypothetical protein [Hyphomicrobiales bacterium]
MSFSPTNGPGRLNIVHVAQSPLDDRQAEKNTVKYNRIIERKRQFSANPISQSRRENFKEDEMKKAIPNLT